MITTEKRFESDIEGALLLSSEWVLINACQKGA